MTALAGKAGYTLLETLMVLAIIALAAVVVMPRGLVMLDRVTAHSVFFDFQRQVADLRREAYNTRTDLVLVEGPPAGPRSRTLNLRARWTYRLERPILITEGGACGRAAVTILKAGNPVMRLTPAEAPCRFVRQD